MQKNRATSLQTVLQECHDLEPSVTRFVVIHRCNEKADIFSYGIVLWEIITQETPQRGTLREIQVSNVVQNCVASCQYLQQSCAARIQCMLAANFFLTLHVLCRCQKSVHRKLLI